MTIRTALLSALVALGAVACAKPSDLPKLHDEAVATVARYQPEIALLDDRVNAILAQGDRLPPGLAGTDTAIATLKDARNHIAELHGITGAAPEVLKKAENPDGKSKHPDPVDGVHAFIDETSEHLELAIRVANADLTSVEAWMAHTKQTPVAQLDGAPKMSGQPTTEAPQPTNADVPPATAPTNQAPPPGVDPNAAR